MNRKLVVILDNIRSALNVGAILRTCDGAGVSKVYLCGITPDSSHHKVQKTALGAEEYVNWEDAENTVEVINQLKNEGFTTVAVEQTNDAVFYHQYEYPQKTALVFGHEITGVSLPVLHAVDAKIELPMAGKKQSLNIATTVGILTYHVLQS